MKLKSIYIASKDLSSSALFYIGLLELDVIGSSEEHIELSDGINLLSYQEYFNRTGILFSSQDMNQPIVLELEILSFDKFLYKLYQSDYTIDYKISVINGRRALHLYDPDRNLVIVVETDDNTKRQSYEPDLVRPEDIIAQYSSTTFIFDKKKDK